MNEGQYLKEYIDNYPMKIAAVVERTGIKRATVYTHFAKERLDLDIKDKYRKGIGIDWSRHKLDNSSNSRNSPRLEATPLYLASEPGEEYEKNVRFTDLGDGILRMRVSLVPHKAYAGYLRGFKDPEFYDELPTVTIDVYKEHKGHYLAFEVEGDSMMATDFSLFSQMALPGWKAIGREVQKHHWKYKLHTHKTDTWIIVHNNEGILIKQIAEHDVDAGTITVHSLNPKYEDETFNLDDIAQIFSVVKYVIDK